MSIQEESDPSNGWESAATQFVESRGRSTIGAARVAAWAQLLPRGAAVLDLGCGSGEPISHVLVERGLRVFGIDASPSMAAAFRERFPGARVACEAVQDSGFFGRHFEGAVAWGLLFLLTAEEQQRLIRRVADVLHPGGRFLFTSPAQDCTWADLTTGRPSLSLGADAYGEVLTQSGLVLAGQFVDEGENHYYDAVKS